jgi:hypothetical protein
VLDAQAPHRPRARRSLNPSARAPTWTPAPLAKDWCTPERGDLTCHQTTSSATSTYTCGDICNGAVNADADAQTAIDLTSVGDSCILSGAAVTLEANAVVGGDVRAVAGLTIGAGAQIINGDAFGSTTEGESGREAVRNQAAGLSGGVTLVVIPPGMTITPGLYSLDFALITGDFTLDAQHDNGAVFIFKVTNYLMITAGVKSILSNGANANNIFWHVDMAVGLGASSEIHGTIISGAAVNLGASAILHGRIFATAAVTLGDSAEVTCDA